MNYIELKSGSATANSSIDVTVVKVNDEKLRLYAAYAPCYERDISYKAHIDLYPYCHADVSPEAGRKIRRRKRGNSRRRHSLALIWTG